MIKSAKIKMTGKLSLLSQLGSAFNCVTFCLQSLQVKFLKPLQVMFFLYLLTGKDIIAILSTGFGKPLLFQHLLDFLPVKVDKNIAIVLCPLSAAG